MKERKLFVGLLTVVLLQGCGNTSSLSVAEDSSSSSGETSSSSAKVLTKDEILDLLKTNFTLKGTNHQVITTASDGKVFVDTTNYCDFKFAPEHFYANGATHTGYVYLNENVFMKEDGYAYASHLDKENQVVDEKATIYDSTQEDYVPYLFNEVTSYKKNPFSYFTSDMVTMSSDNKKLSFAIDKKVGEYNPALILFQTLTQEPITSVKSLTVTLDSNYLPHIILADTGEVTGSMFVTTTTFDYTFSDIGTTNFKALTPCLNKTDVEPVVNGLDALAQNNYTITSYICGTTNYYNTEITYPTLENYVFKVTPTGYYTDKEYQKSVVKKTTGVSSVSYYPISGKAYEEKTSSTTYESLLPTYDISENFFIKQKEGVYKVEPTAAQTVLKAMNIPFDAKYEHMDTDTFYIYIYDGQITKISFNYNDIMGVEPITYIYDGIGTTALPFDTTAVVPHVDKPKTQTEFTPKEENYFLEYFGKKFTFPFVNSNSGEQYSLNELFYISEDIIPIGIEMSATLTKDDGTADTENLTALKTNYEASVQKAGWTYKGKATNSTLDYVTGEEYTKNDCSAFFYVDDSQFTIDILYSSDINLSDNSRVD
jgi:hypothetical protein